jgi:periplasmic protein TonB
MTEKKGKFRIKIFAKPDTQPSLFHYIKETPDSSVFENIDWSFLRHPISSFKEARRSPRTKASLFHYLEEDLEKEKKTTPFSWKEFFKELVAGFRNPLFIPSVFSDPESLALDRARGRTRKWEAGMLSVVLHVGIIGSLVLLAYDISKQQQQPDKDKVIEITPNPIELPVPPNVKGDSEGGGGGGGRLQQALPAAGRLPPSSTSPTLVPPDLDARVLLPSEELIAQVATVNLPFNFPQDMSLGIGVIDAPPNNSTSYGPGRGGGVGSGVGLGFGSGTGDGVGPGSGGGTGGGTTGGVKVPSTPPPLPPMNPGGPGMTDPIILLNPTPNYTEDARKARREGIVEIEAIIRKNGSVDSFKVVKSLGYGLDESAIQTIANKWRFKPGTYKGEAVDVKARISVSFKIY